MYLYSGSLVHLFNCCFPPALSKSLRAVSYYTFTSFTPLIFKVAFSTFWCNPYDVKPSGARQKPQVTLTNFGKKQETQVTLTNFGKKQGKGYDKLS